MDVNIDEMTSTIDAAGGESPPSAGSPAPSADELEILHREIRSRLLRDALRTRAEDYDD